MKRYKFLLAFIIFAMTACKKEKANHPPADFSLIKPAPDSKDVSVTPNFTWQEAVDPEGSKVTYSLYIGTDASPDSVVENSLSNTSYTLTERLHLHTTYYWKVVAKDADGHQAESNISNFTTRDIPSTWTEATQDATFRARMEQSSLMFKGEMWVIGGTEDPQGGREFNSVWYSTDGVQWTEAIANAGFSARYDHSSVVYDGKIWVIGGSEGDFYSPVKNDVWYSTDGIQWTEATANAAFTPRTGHTSVVYDGKMWVIGGGERYNNVNLKNDVWYSTDGIHWTEATANAEFSPRTEHTSLVYDGKIWVIGGTDSNNKRKNDVWYSTDGIHWIEATANADFPARSWHSSVVYDGKMWVIAGFSEGPLLNDVWYSTDGINWTAAPNASFKATYGQTSLVYDDKIWIISGYITGGQVWYVP